LLETGGGMVRADRNGLLPDTFFALNSDNIWLDGPRDVFTELSDAWDDARMDALVLVVRHPGAHNYQGVGDFHLDPLGRVSRRRHGRVAPYIYTGIQLVSRRLLRDAPEGPFPPTSCGTARSRKGACSVWSTRANGSRWASRAISPRPRPC
jgi:MurNAc alpha-1-phosphate uridylyltransferase